MSRVALVLGTSTGGVGQHVLSLVRRLPTLGHQVTVYGPASTDELFGFSGAGATFVPVPISAGPRPVADLRAVRRLRSELPAFDLVHAHGLRAAAFAGLALGRRRPGRTPLVATWHNAILGTGLTARVLEQLERVAARRADVTLGASTDLVERARSLGAHDARPGLVAAPALGVARRAPADVRAELGVGDRPLIVAVGRLAPQKAYDVLLDAATALTDLDPQPLVVVAGDGPLLMPLQAKAATLAVPVRFLGRRADVADLLAAADAVVLTSTWEARALVAQEALRAGVPLVATAVGGVPELVGDAALLAPVGDAARVGRELRRLLLEPGLAEQMVARGRAQAKSWPDEDAVVADLVRTYRELGARP